jgi:hypothetical protein
MSQQVEAILVEGIVDALTFQFVANPLHVVVELGGVSKKVAIFGAPFFQVSDRIRAVCLATPNANGLYEAVDFIRNEHDRPITNEQRAEQASRVGLRPIYDTPSSLTIQPVISKITEIGLELIAHLKRHPELLQVMHSEAFEKLIAELLASGGFDVEWTGRNGKTGGDVIAFKKIGAWGWSTTTSSSASAMVLIDRSGSRLREQFMAQKPLKAIPTPYWSQRRLFNRA